jgi:hypothetical protein
MSGDHGELTEPVYWRGKQWAVTGYGIEGLKDWAYYNIEASQLTMQDRDGLSMWPDHMAEKNDINTVDFNRALLKAIEIHKPNLPPKAIDAIKTLVRMKPRNDNFK